jgi:hypothetical protein
MALGSTQPLTEMSIMNLPGGKGWLVREADNHTAICEPTVWKIWEPRCLTTLWAFTACYMDSFTFTCVLCRIRDDGQRSETQYSCIKYTIFWNVMLCSLLDAYCSFGEMSGLHLQGRKVCQTSRKQRAFTTLHDLTSQKIVFFMFSL